MLNLRVSFINTVQYGAGVTHSFPYSLIISFRVPWQQKWQHMHLSPHSRYYLNWKELKHKLTSQAVLTMIDDTSSWRPTKSDESHCGTKGFFLWSLSVRINLQYLCDCKLLFAGVGPAYWMGLWTFITIDPDLTAFCSAQSRSLMFQLHPSLPVKATKLANGFSLYVFNYKVLCICQSAFSG